MLLQILGSICIITASAITLIVLAVAADEWWTTRQIEKRLRRRYPR